MSAWTLTLIFVALLTLVAGQLLLKWALNDGDHEDESRRMSSGRRAQVFAERHYRP